MGMKILLFLPVLSFYLIIWNADVVEVYLIWNNVLFFLGKRIYLNWAYFIWWFYLFLVLKKNVSTKSRKLSRHNIANKRKWKAVQHNMTDLMDNISTSHDRPLVRKKLCYNPPYRKIWRLVHLPINLSTRKPWKCS